MIRRGPGPSFSAPPMAHRGPMPPPPPGLQNPVSNVTNSNDFASKNSRVFVGNLNTFSLSKEDVDRIFTQYGFVTGISMHKGYAFVQYGHPGEARRAVAFENGNSYGGQILDLNIVAEPKKGAPRRPGVPPAPVQNNRRPPMQQASPSVSPVAKRPRQDSNASMQRSNLVTLSNSSVSVNSSPSAPVRPRPVTALNAAATRAAAAAAVKRAATTVTRAATTTVTKTAASQQSTSATVAPGKDVLICGVCKLQFTSLHSLAQHKKIPCRLRTSCQCQTNPPKPPVEEKQLDCATCDARFDSAWALCQHCHKEHSMRIFKTAGDEAKAANSAGASKTGAKEMTSAEEEKDQDGGNKAKKAKTETATPAKK